MLADIAESVALSLSGVSQTLHLGGAGAMDVIVIAAITAVLIKELVGEFTERVKRGAKDAQKEASR
mgnify:CR=1 FL=1